MKWTPPEPTIETCHDVRRLKVCCVCGHPGSDLIRGLFMRSMVSKGKPSFVHGYCLISSQENGWEMFAALPSEEIGKITMSEWKALGIPYERVAKAYENAVKRERAKTSV